jgi:hypothetical protein
MGEETGILEGSKSRDKIGNIENYINIQVSKLARLFAHCPHSLSSSWNFLSDR